MARRKGTNFIFSIICLLNKRFKGPIPPDWRPPDKMLPKTEDPIYILNYCLPVLDHFLHFPKNNCSILVVMNLSVYNDILLGKRVFLHQIVSLFSTFLWNSHLYHSLYNYYNYIHFLHLYVHENSIMSSSALIYITM